jgi:hypothetical protein
MILGRDTLVNIPPQAYGEGMNHKLDMQRAETDKGEALCKNVKGLFVNGDVASNYIFIENCLSNKVIIHFNVLSPVMIHRVRRES